MKFPILNDYSEQVKMIDPSKRVHVYRNLRTKAFSVRQGNVRFHTTNISLSDVNFVVRESGRQRVLKEQRKNVHSWVSGFLSEKIVDSDLLLWYNPYKVSQFQCNGVPILKGSACHLTTQKICVTL